MTPYLFRPLKIREIEFRNRVFVSPMCQYSCRDGLATDWHLVHLGSRAAGGASLVIAEASGVSPEGRISAGDLGIWSTAHAEALRPVTEFIASQGAVPGIQIAHAGRKASTAAPWDGGQPVPPDAPEGWVPWGPSAAAFDQGYTVPREMSRADIDLVVEQFVAGARHALRAGFRVLELHMAHGYLLHEFLSPLSNLRQDEYGGPLENRLRLPLRIAREVRAAWPRELPLFVRISATDWTDGGWDLPQSVRLSRELRELGVDFIDVSSGGVVPRAKISVGPGYQVPFSEAIRREVGVPTGAVGMITDAEQAEAILSEGRADAVLLARELLRDPYWPLHAAARLGADVNQWPKQYGYAVARR